MSLEKAIDDLRKEIVILNQNLTILGEAKPSPYDDLPSDTEPAEEKPKPKPKPKAKKAPPMTEAEAVEQEIEEQAKDDEGLTLLVVQQRLTELSKKDRAAAKGLVEDFTPAGGPAKLSAVPEKDFQALIDAVDEALEG